MLYAQKDIIINGRDKLNLMCLDDAYAMISY